MTEHQQLQALLRIKRYEQPPSGYYEKLLQDVHRRQRSELLRRPLWSIAVERIQTFFSEHSMGGLSYAGAMAAVAVAGVLAIQTAGNPGQPGVSVASVEVADLQEPAPTTMVAAIDPAPAQMLSLEQSGPVIPAPHLEDLPHDARLLPAKASAGLAKAHQPRYVIDSRPVSYEAANVSFSF